MLTPAMLRTAGMEYAFKSDKARRVLGYKPAYSVDQGIQHIVWHNNKQRKSSEAKAENMKG